MAGLFDGPPSPLRPENTVLGSLGNLPPRPPRRIGRLESILGRDDRPAPPPEPRPMGRLESIIGRDDRQSSSRRFIPVAEKLAPNPMKDDRVLDSFPKSVTIIDENGVRTDVTSEYSGAKIRDIIDHLARQREPRPKGFDIVGTDPYPSSGPRWGAEDYIYDGLGKKGTGTVIVESPPKEELLY